MTLTPLTVVDLDVILVRAPLAREFRGSYYRMTHRATVVVRLVTDQGIVGEAYVGDEDATATEIVDVLRKEIAPPLIGMDAMATEKCWAAMYPATFDILRDRRIGLVALAAADTAMWDAVGKALDQPLWRLWGGARERVPMIAIGGYYGEPLGPIAEEIAYYRDDSDSRGSSSRSEAAVPRSMPSGWRRRGRPPVRTSRSASTRTRGTRWRRPSGSAN